MQVLYMIFLIDLFNCNIGSKFIIHLNAFGFNCVYHAEGI
jgi:hypothetical protein